MEKMLLKLIKFIGMHGMRHKCCHSPFHDYASFFKNQASFSTKMSEKNPDVGWNKSSKSKCARSWKDSKYNQLKGDYNINPTSKRSI